ncbi:hypothetical protein CAPTEDRAFT_177140 [Capitella teleta]|uniref:glutathione transferase n=1 Tax=Capitella teleta TaxID=283909 RepID=R7UQY9_CAPTE|nr:hypothetical protein CAPTEDRAFT_177140 [Capitella teleta]|eukprot:ELU08528.1 hypothetical protein CAPTEDRAFT_177140 [Capitella teleta]
MPQYKLVYFDVRGLAEEARWLFALAGQPYEDYRLKDGEWDALKPDTPCGQVPMLVVDGKKLSQSKAIQRYLANEFGFIGETDLERARGDMIADYLDDLRAYLMAIHREQNEAKQEEMTLKFKELMPGFLENFEKLLKENKGGDGFFVGNKVTWTDVFFASSSSVLERFASPNYLDAYPKLKALVLKVVALPAIADWIKRRPVTLH